MPTYRQHIADKQICGDCVNGAIKGAVWSELGKRKPVYASHGCPDTNADGMFAKCKAWGMEWGSMSSVPDEPGIGLHMAGHVGVTVGNGEVVEWRGFDYGCVTTKLAKRKWVHWFRLPWVEYISQPEAGTDQTQEAALGTLGSRLLKRGCKGPDVKTLQGILMQFGYDLSEYKDDGDYGAETEKAVVAFQKDQKLKADGKYGDKSHAALMAELAERTDDEDDEDEVVSCKKVEVTSGNSVNVRKGAGTQFEIETVVHRGDVFDHIATAENGWHAINVDGKTGWISYKYTTVK